MRALAAANQGILIDSLALQEAKASSEIENIVTTQDELFQLGLFPDGLESGAAGIYQQRCPPVMPCEATS